MITVRSFLVLGLSLVCGLAIFGAQIGRAVTIGREFEQYLSVKGLSEREVKANLAIWPIRFSVAAEDLGVLQEKMETNSAIVLSFLRDNGIDTTEIVQGLPIVSDREDERLQRQTPTLPRYRGVVSLVVRSANVDVVKKAIQRGETLLSKGVGVVGNDAENQTHFIYTALLLRRLSRVSTLLSRQIKISNRFCGIAWAGLNDCARS